MGFVIADRELFEHEIWLAEPFTKGQAWLDLIALANHSDTRLLIRNKIIECKRGDVNRSLRFLSRRWQWSMDKVVRYITFLETEQMVERKTEQGETVLTICNYCYWQDRYLKNKTENRTDFRTQTEHPPNTNNNINNSNNIFKQSSYAKREEDERWLEEMNRKISQRLSK